MGGPMAAGRAGVRRGAAGAGARGVARGAPGSGRGAEARRRVGVEAGVTAGGGEQDGDWEELAALKSARAERAGQYATRLAALDAPEWLPARVISVREEARGKRVVRLDCEVSRELVPLQKAYRRVGQRAQIKIRGRGPWGAAPASAPFSTRGAQERVLFKLKGDLTAGQTKLPVEATSVRGELQLLLDEKEDPELWDALVEGEEAVELGPFLGAGIGIQGTAIQQVFAYPLVVILAEGQGIAAAKALVEAGDDAGGLCLGSREQARLFYRVRNEEEACFADRFERWARDFNVKATPTTGSFLDAWDADDELEYEPEETAVVVFGSAEAEEQAQELCEEAEIGLLVRSSVEADDVEFLASDRVV